MRSRGKFAELSMRDWEPIGAGGESVWSYSHLPRGVYDAETASALATRMD